MDDTRARTTFRSAPALAGRGFGGVSAVERVTGPLSMGSGVSGGAGVLVVVAADGVGLGVLGVLGAGRRGATLSPGAVTGSWKIVPAGLDGEAGGGVVVG